MSKASEPRLSEPYGPLLPLGCVEITEVHAARGMSMLDPRWHGLRTGRWILPLADARHWVAIGVARAAKMPSWEELQREADAAWAPEHRP